MSVRRREWKTSKGETRSAWILTYTGTDGLTEQWTALLTWDHISNAHLCAHNAGMNEYGVKIGYSF